MSFDSAQTNSRNKDGTFSSVERKQEMFPEKRELLEIITTLNTTLCKYLLMVDKRLSDD